MDDLGGKIWFASSVFLGIHSAVFERSVSRMQEGGVEVSDTDVVRMRVEQNVLRLDIAMDNTHCMQRVYAESLHAVLIRRESEQGSQPLATHHLSNPPSGTRTFHRTLYNGKQIALHERLPRHPSMGVL